MGDLYRCRRPDLAGVVFSLSRCHSIGLRTGRSKHVKKMIRLDSVYGSELPCQSTILKSRSDVACSGTTTRLARSYSRCVGRLDLSTFELHYDRNISRCVHQANKDSSPASRKTWPSVKNKKVFTHKVIRRLAGRVTRAASFSSCGDLPFEYSGTCSTHWETALSQTIAGVYRTMLVSRDYTFFTLAHSAQQHAFLMWKYI